MKAPKFIGNIKAWFKRNVFVTPLKPRTALAFSFVTILLTILPIAIVWFSIIGMLDATILYKDEVSFSNTDIIGIILLLLIIFIAIILSLIKIFKITKAAYKKRKANIAAKK